MAAISPLDRAAPKRVLVVDGQRAFAELLELACRSADGLECVGTAGSGEEAVDLVSTLAPDVVVMDVALPGVDGIEAARRIAERSPETAVVLLTALRDPSLVARAASAGACAYLVKEASVEEIVDTLRNADHRAPLVSAPALVGPEEADDADLTQRELEVLGLLARGRQPKQIAHDLGITVNTCRGYVKNILAKLDAHSALEAVLEANRRGIITLPGS